MLVEPRVCPAGTLLCRDRAESAAFEKTDLVLIVAGLICLENVIFSLLAAFHVEMEFSAISKTSTLCRAQPHYPVTVTLLR